MLITSQPHNSIENLNSLICAYCGWKTSRPSHLTRHVASHLPANQRHGFSCSICSKKFARNDVLIRHQRTAHQMNLALKRNSQKSCLRCAAKKLGCDRARPCRACLKAETTCSYISNDESQGYSSVTDERSPLNSGIGQVDAASDGLEHGRNSSAILNQEPSKTSEIGHFHNPSGSVASAYHSSSEARQSSSIDGTYPVTFSDPSPESCAEIDSATVENNDIFFQICDPDFGLTQESLYWGGVGGMGLDWLDFELLEKHGQESYTVPHLSHPIGAISTLYDATLSKPTADPFLQPYGNRTQSRPQVLQSNAAGRASRPSSRLTEQFQPPAQLWPFAHSRETTLQLRQLPPLREMLRNIPLSVDDPTTLETLIGLLSEPFLPDVNDNSENFGLLPAVQLLRRATDAFFEQFHDILPIIHVPTWNISECPTVLLAAMACIGAMFLDDTDSCEKSLSLSDICSQMIIWLGGTQSANYDDISYLTACCLHQIFSLGSGNRSLYQNADRSRGMLIGSLRGIGLFRARLGVEEDHERRFGDDAFQAGSDPSLIQADWLRWRDLERERRVAWASFEYDCSLCTLTNRRGAIDLSELPPHLPCIEALWQASSPQAWQALLAQASFAAKGAPLPDVLKTLLSGKPLPSTVSSWGKRLCSQIIGRLLWDLRQLEAAWISDFLGITSMNSAQRQMKRSLLHAFSALTATMTTATNTSELINFNIARLIYHFSHLYTAEDILDLVVHVLRSTATIRPDELTSSRISPSDAELTIAKSRLITKLLHSPQRTRKLVWHAAQIIAVADCYLVSAPCEVLRIFMGYSFIMAFARYATPLHCEAANQAPRTDIAQLDLLNPSESQQQSIAQWISSGGLAGLGLVGNICTDTCVPAVSRQAQSTMRKMRGWGLAERFAKILHHFELGVR